MQGKGGRLVTDPPSGPLNNAAIMLDLAIQYPPPGLSSGLVALLILKPMHLSTWPCSAYSWVLHARGFAALHVLPAAALRKQHATTLRYSMTLP